MKDMCNVLYSAGHGKRLWIMAATPMTARKHIIANLRKFDPEAKYIAHRYGKLTDQQVAEILNAGQFPPTKGDD